MKDFAHRIKDLKAEVEALKTASRSDADGLNTITKTINMTAKLIVYAGYVAGRYFIELTPTGTANMIFSTSQKHATAADDVIISAAVPRLKNGEIGVEIEARINYQRQQWYLDNYNQGDTIQMPISIKITSTDDFTYTITEDN